MGGRLVGWKSCRKEVSLGANLSSNELALVKPKTRSDKRRKGKERTGKGKDSNST